MSNAELIKTAKRIALEELNTNRKEKGMPPLTKVGNFWWGLYGKAYIDKVAEGIK